MTCRLPWAKVILAIAFLCLTASMLVRLVHRVDQHDGDLFTYYQASRDLLAGQSPYQSSWYVYPPLWAQLVVPLALLPPRAYAIVWGLVLGALWLVNIALIRRLLGRSNEDMSWLVDVLPSLLLFRWILSGWAHGQVALLVLSLVLWTAICEREGEIGRASFLLALAAAIKVFPAFLGLLFVESGKRRGMLFLACFSIILWSLPALSFGVDRLRELLCDGFFGSAMTSLEARQLHPDNRSPVSAVFRAVGAPDSVRAYTFAWALMCTVVVLWLPRPSADREKENLWFAYILSTMIMVTPIIWPHYFTLLLFPLAAMIQYATRLPANDVRRLAIWGILGVSTILFHVNSTLFVSGSTCEYLERFEFITVGFLVLWVGLGMLVVQGRQTVAVTIAAPRASPTKSMS